MQQKELGCISSVRNSLFKTFFISNFLRVVTVVFFLLVDSLASEFYAPTFRNTIRSIFYRWNRLSVPKRQNVKFRRQGITQK